MPRGRGQPSPQRWKVQEGIDIFYIKMEKTREIHYHTFFLALSRVLGRVEKLGECEREKIVRLETEIAYWRSIPDAGGGPFVPEQRGLRLC